MSVSESYLLIGSAVARSPSPEMMNEAFRASGVRAVYSAESVEVGRLEAFYRWCVQNHVAGMNITMPFKTEVIPLLDQIEPEAKKVGAVNTVKREGRRYRGFNTDIEGILKPLLRLGYAEKIRRSAVIGAGGAARAFVGAMDRVGCKDVSVILREPRRARRFLEDLRREFPQTGLDVRRIVAEELKSLSGLDLLFNAAPIGSDGTKMPGVILALLKERLLVFDAVYEPIDTELAKGARAANCPFVPGYEMLLAQGAAAFEIWTGKRAPEDEMRQALLSKLRKEPS